MGKHQVKEEGAAPASLHSRSRPRATTKLGLRFSLASDLATSVPLDDASCGALRGGAVLTPGNHLRARFFAGFLCQSSPSARDYRPPSHTY